MYCGIPENNKIAYEVVEFIKQNSHLIYDSNEELVKNVIESLCVEDEERQLIGLVSFINAFNSIFDGNKILDNSEYLVNKHYEFTIKVGILAFFYSVNKDYSIKDGVYKVKGLVESDLFVFLGVPLFMKNSIAYRLDGVAMYNDIMETRKQLDEDFYVFGSVFGELYDLTD